MQAAAAPAPKARKKAMKAKAMEAPKALKKAMKAAAAPVPKARKKTMKAKPMKARLRLDRSDEIAKRATRYKELKKTAEKAMALHQQVAALAFEVTGLTAQISSLQADLGDQAQSHCVDLMHAREIQEELREENARLRQRLAGRRSVLGG